VRGSWGTRRERKRDTVDASDRRAAVGRVLRRSNIASICCRAARRLQRRRQLAKAAAVAGLLETVAPFVTSSSVAADGLVGGGTLSSCVARSSCDVRAAMAAAASIP
jgi:hypothetical protein